MSKFSITKEKAVEVRLQCLKSAVDILAVVNIGNHIPPDKLGEMIIKQCEEIEKYAWGLHAPIEDAPTPLNTISECLDAAQSKIDELIKNSPSIGEHRTDLLRMSIPMIERVRADIDRALTVT